ncbi:hypothetical protein DM811_02925 [Blattabacterium punctulatus]|nr:hypothetical protein DM811_02925 [Blattabacterium punctulatus]
MKLFIEFHQILYGKKFMNFFFIKKNILKNKKIYHKKKFGIFIIFFIIKKIYIRNILRYNTNKWNIQYTID